MAGDYLENTSENAIYYETDRCPGDYDKYDINLGPFNQKDNHLDVIYNAVRGNKVG